jgi:hypothetical protein
VAEIAVFYVAVFAVFYFTANTVSYIEFLGDDVTPDPTKIPPLKDLHKFLEMYDDKGREKITAATIVK